MRLMKEEESFHFNLKMVNTKGVMSPFLPLCCIFNSQISYSPTLNHGKATYYISVCVCAAIFTFSNLFGCTCVNWLPYTPGKSISRIVKYHFCEKVEPPQVICTSVSCAMDTDNIPAIEIACLHNSYTCTVSMTCKHTVS